MAESECIGSADEIPGIGLASINPFSAAVARTVHRKRRRRIPTSGFGSGKRCFATHRWSFVAWENQACREETLRSSPAEFARFTLPGRLGPEVGAFIRLPIRPIARARPPASAGNDGILDREFGLRESQAKYSDTVHHKSPSRPADPPLVAIKMRIMEANSRCLEMLGTGEQLRRTSDRGSPDLGLSGTPRRALFEASPNRGRGGSTEIPNRIF